MNNIHHADSRVAFWKPLNEGTRVLGQDYYENCRGDPVAMVSKVIQIVKGTGIAEGKEIPLRIPFGSDGLAALREKLHTLQKTYDEWESVAKSTDFAGK